MFKIEVATEVHIPAIVEIAEETWWPTYKDILTPTQIRYMLDVIYAPATLASQIRSGDQTYLVLADERGTSAFASYGPSANAGIYRIHKLYVRPRGQKSGYGRALIDHIVARSQQTKIRFLDLNVNRFNPARGFYENAGFRIIREEDIPIGPYWMNDYVMRKDLLM